MNDQTLLWILEEEPDRGIALMARLYAEPVRFAAAQHLDNARDVKECVQDTFTDFYLQRDRFDPEKGSLRGYLTTIARRKAIRRYQENQRQWLASQRSRSAANDIGDWERRDLLNQALGQLSQSDQQLLRLRYFEGSTLREAAEQMGLEYETVKKRAQRALAKLIRLLEE